MICIFLIFWISCTYFSAINLRKLWDFKAYMIVLGSLDNLPFDETQSQLIKLP